MKKELRCVVCMSQLHTKNVNITHCKHVPITDKENRSNCSGVVTLDSNNVTTTSHLCTFVQIQ